MRSTFENYRHEILAFKSGCEQLLGRFIGNVTAAFKYSVCVCVCVSIHNINENNKCVR